ncbi:DUF6390 family protein [Jatrophihabitans sp.]|uniref:DUF6390 family protein n=1 Tax=Jatrophihabitans sp. TaxID=1932789 RepID=UPI002F1B8F40
MSDGSRLFARFAFAPNDLGYCGPAETATLFELAVTGDTDADVTAIARGFSGAWPYLALLAELAGIDDPLDERLVRAYWTGSALLRDLDQQAFGSRLIDFLGSRAGHYWRHLSADLLPEATPTHGFHVFGVYPWSRLLNAASGQPLHVLDSCRIRWGQVQAVESEHVVVRSRRLSWDGCHLELAAPAQERVRLSVGGRGFVEAPRPGEWLALHWDWVCDRLTPAEQAELQHWTGWQLDATNERLARERKASQ